MKNEQKNILAFMNAFSYGKSGGDLAFIEILKRLKKYNKTIITSKNGMLLCREMKLNSLFLITSSDQRFNHPKILYLIRTIIAILMPKKTKNTIMISSTDFFPDVIPAFLMKNRTNRWIQIIYHFYPHYNERSGDKLINILWYYLQRFSFFLIRNKADQVIVATNIIKEKLISIGIDGNKISVCPLGVNLEYISKVKKSKKKFDAIYLGRLNFGKGLVELIEIWAKVIKKNPSAKLAIIGEDYIGIKNKLVKMAQDYNMKSNVFFLGYLRKSDVFSLLKSAKLFLCASHEEGFGIALAEAIVCKIPVVSWDLAVFKEIFKDYTTQIEEYNSSLFAQKIIELLVDSKKRSEISKSAFKYIKKYTWDASAIQFIKIIESNL